MRDTDQQIIKFSYEKNMSTEDFFISKSNKHIFDLIESWPRWDRNFLNISGEKFSGKTHLINIFIKRFNGIKIESNLLNNEKIKEIKVYQNVILENLDKNIDENLFYTLIDIIDQDNKFLIVTSDKSIVDIKFELNDLTSRAKNFLLQNIEKPDDELISALLIKNLSDRQISIQKKLIDYIVKRINRSYRKIFEFIYKIDEMSLKKKKSIDLKIIKEVLGE